MGLEEEETRAGLQAGSWSRELALTGWCASLAPLSV